MSLHLTSRGLLRRAKSAIEHGPARSGAIMVTSAAVGVAAGKRGEMKNTSFAAVATGVGLNMLGFHTLGDGSLAGGLSMLGYRTGAKQSSSPMAAAPSPAPAGKKKA